MSRNIAKVLPAMGADTASLLERENARLQSRIAELERLVATDTLTPLFNQRHFMEELDRWCWRAHRYGGTYGLLFCDVDKLKSINDIQGHGIGDDVLRAVASALLSAVRKSDIVSRVGGDEFTILLDSIPPTQLDDKLATVRAMLADMLVKTAGPDLRVSVSVGSSLIEGNSRPTDILAAADQAMYAHKRSKYSA